MPIDIKISVQDVEVLTQQLKGIRSDTEDLSEGFKKAEVAFQSAVQDIFQSNNFGTWQKLSEKYLAQKVKKQGFLAYVGIERDSDRLYDSLVGKTSDTVSQINKQDATFGTTVPYAKAQHFGYEPRNLPARPLINLSESQLQDVGNAIKKELVATVRRRRTLVVNEENFNFV